MYINKYLFTTCYTTGIEINPKKQTSTYNYSLGRSIAVLQGKNTISKQKLK